MSRTLSLSYQQQQREGIMNMLCNDDPEQQKVQVLNTSCLIPRLCTIPLAPAAESEKSQVSILDY